MHGSNVWSGHPTLSRPLTILGVERRWFFLAATVGLGMWNAINSIVTAGLIFGTLYAAGLLAWRRDPAMLNIIAAGADQPEPLRPRQAFPATVELVER